jgi:hypothetical protein
MDVPLAEVIPQTPSSLGMIPLVAIFICRSLEEKMGLKSRLKKHVGRILDQFSGEHPEAAPEDRTPYSRPGVPNDGAEVVMARLNRPKSLSASKKSDDKED